MMYLIETQPTVYHWLFSFYKSNPIPKVRLRLHLHLHCGRNGVWCARCVGVLTTVDLWLGEAVAVGMAWDGTGRGGADAGGCEPWSRWRHLPTRIGHNSVECAANLLRAAVACHTNPHTTKSFQILATGYAAPALVGGGSAVWASMRARACLLRCGCRSYFGRSAGVSTPLACPGDRLSLLRCPLTASVCPERNNNTTAR